jgi:hypothetical protein
MNDELLPYIAALKTAYINHAYASNKLIQAREWNVYSANADARRNFDSALKDWTKAEVAKNKAEQALLAAVNSYKFW